MKTKSYFIKLSITVAALLAMLTLFAFAGVHGDVDADGNVSAADARLALRASVGLEKYAEGTKEFIASDADADGSLTAADARLILRASVNLETLQHAFSECIAEKNASGLYTGRHYGKCTICGEEQYEDCTFGEKVCTVKATCTEDGEYTITCSKCGATKVSGEASLGHLKSKKMTSLCVAATCTSAGKDVYYCNRCGKNIEYETPALGHSINVEKATCVTSKKCTRCNEVFEYSFNDLVNTLKDGTHTVSGFSKTTSSNKVNDSDISYSSSMKTMIKLMGSSADDFPSEDEFKELIGTEFSGSEIEYSLVSVLQNKITNDNLPVYGSDKVSALLDSDIESVKTETVSGIDFLGTLEDTIKIGSNSYSISRYKNAEIGEVKKVTVTVKTEKYTAIKDSKEDTALMRIGGSDIRELANRTTDLTAEADFSDLGDFSSTCKEVVSTGTVTYYFDAKTNAPIAAMYSMNYNLNFYLSIDLAITTDTFGEEFEDFASFLLEGKDRLELMSGFADFTTEMTENIYYFFDNWFTAE